MPKLIRQSVTLPASAAQLYAMYLDPKAHAAFTGGKVKVSARRGSKFSAFDGALSGSMLHTVPGRLIVQSWRSTAFRVGDVDSTLIILFTPKGKACRIDLTHVNVADHDEKGVTEGWKKYYWGPWRAYLAQTAKGGKRK